MRATKFLEAVFTEGSHERSAERSERIIEWATVTTVKTTAQGSVEFVDREATLRYNSTFLKSNERATKRSTERSIKRAALESNKRSTKTALSSDKRVIKRTFLKSDKRAALGSN